MKNFKIDTQLFAGEAGSGIVSRYVGEEALQELVSKMKQYVDNKEITLEDSVLENSSNGVKSSGIYTALSAKQNTLTAGANITIANNVISASGVAEVTASTIRIYGYDPGVYKLNSAAGSGEISIFYNGSTSTDALEINDHFNNQCVLMISYNQDSPSKKSYTWVLVSSGKIYVGNTTSTSGTYSELQTKLTFDASPTSASTNPVTSGGVYTALSGKQASLNTNQLAAVNSGITSTLVGQISTNQNNITSLSSSKQDVLTFDTSPTNGSTNPVTSDGVFDADEAIRGSVTTINNKIPSQASSSNQLADKAFVNSSINAFAAYYITKNAAGDPFATKAELSAATTFYSGGATRTPTTNDYCIVLADESKQSATGVDPTTRYSYQGNQWEYQYTVNDTPLTAAQLAALNSGITTSLVTQIGTNQSNISTLQTNVSTLQGSSHTHSNKSVLDGITAAKVTSWDSKQDAMTAITTAEVDALFD